MAGELSERLIRRSARIAARQTMLIRSIDQRFGNEFYNKERNKTLDQVLSRYDKLPRSLESQSWSPFTESASQITASIIQQLDRRK